MNKEHLQRITDQERLFCDQAGINSNKEFFLFSMFSGIEVDNFVLTPAHAKRFLLSLTSNIHEYEKKFGDIDPNLADPIISPMQFPK